jgi:hypothetical protein
VTDQTNHGQGTTESVSVGLPGHRNYFVQADVYFNFGTPAGVGWERYGVFLRDDGFAGLNTTFEGAGNCYAILWDTDDGRLRAARIVDAAITDLISPARYVTGSAWRTMRIEARGNQIKFFLNSELLVQVNDTTFSSGQCGVGYVTHRTDWPATRGAYFDNFIADTLDTTPRFENVNLQPDGKIRFVLSGDTNSTNVIERAPDMTNWMIFTNVVNVSNTVQFLDNPTNSATQFYRAKRLP